MGKVIGVKLQIRMLAELRKEILSISLRVCIIALHKYKQMRRHRVSTKALCLRIRMRIAIAALQSLHGVRHACLDAGRVFHFLKGFVKSKFLIPQNRLEERELGFA